MTTVIARSQAAWRSKRREPSRHHLDYSLRSPCGPACGCFMP